MKTCQKSLTNKPGYVFIYILTEVVIISFKRVHLFCILALFILESWCCIIISRLFHFLCLIWKQQLCFCEFFFFFLIKSWHFTFNKPYANLRNFNPFNPETKLPRKNIFLILITWRDPWCYISLNHFFKDVIINKSYCHEEYLGLEGALLNSAAGDY